MKWANVLNAAELLAVRKQLFVLKNLAITKGLAIGVGDPAKLNLGPDAGVAVIDFLLDANGQILRELGVTALPVWQPPARPHAAEP